MSDPDDVTTRLSHALDEIFKGGNPPDDESPADAPAEAPSAAPRVVEPDPYQLPEIVPATEDVPVLPRAERPPVTVTEPVAVAPSIPAVAPVAAAAPAPAPAAPAQATPPVPTTSWGDHLPQTTTVASGPQLRAPGRRPRVRKVTRVVRHVDPWSTFKLALVFSLVAYLVCLTSGVLLWRVANSTGTLDNVERWFTQFGWETFEFDGGEIFHNAWIIGLFMAVGLTGAAVLMATLFNLVSDIVGGIRVTVLEEEVVERTASSARRYVVRRPPVAGAAASWNVDDPPEPEPAADEPKPARAETPPPAADWSVDDDEPV